MASEARPLVGLINEPACQGKAILTIMLMEQGGQDNDFLKLLRT